MAASLWPFAASHGFFEHLTESGRYVAADGGTPAEFHFPGLLRDEALPAIFYTRSDDDVERPEIRATTKAEALTQLASAGWTPAIPIGPQRLRSLDARLDSGRLILGAPQRAYIRGNVEDRIHAVALAFNDWLHPLDSGRRGLVPNRVTIEHFKSCIGRCWQDRAFSRDIGIFPAGGGSTRYTRDELDAEDWMLGDLEVWVERGIQAMPTALNTGTNASILDAQFDDFTFSHVNEDGTLGERLYNGPDGKTQADWDAYVGAQYELALRRGNSTMTASGVSVTVEQGASATVRVVPSGGVEPYSFAVAMSEAWASVAADGTVTVSPDATVTAEDHRIVITVTDRVYGTLNVAVTATVTAAASNGD